MRECPLREENFNVQMTGDNAILQHSKVYNLGIIQFVGIIKCCDQSGLRMKKFTIILLQKNNNHNFLIWWHQMAFISLYKPTYISLQSSLWTLDTKYCCQWNTKHMILTMYQSKTLQGPQWVHQPCTRAPTAYRLLKASIHS